MAVTTTGAYCYTMSSNYNAYGQNDQGRAIGVSSILALGGGKLLVLERDNRGIGTETNLANLPVSKRVYLVDMNGAVDVSGTVITDNPPIAGAVTKELLLVDLVADLRARGLPVPEKVEGLAFGELLADGGRTLLLITDNDYSVTQNGGSVQFDVCFDAGFTSSTQVAIGGACPGGTQLLPNYIFSYRLGRDEYRSLAGLPAVPEPANWAMMIGGMSLVGGAARRRKRVVAVA